MLETNYGFRKKRFRKKLLPLCYYTAAYHNAYHVVDQHATQALLRSMMGRLQWINPANRLVRALLTVLQMVRYRVLDRANGYIDTAGNSVLPGGLISEDCRPPGGTPWRGWNDGALIDLCTLDGSPVFHGCNQKPRSIVNHLTNIWETMQLKSLPVPLNAHLEVVKRFVMRNDQDAQVH